MTAGQPEGVGQQQGREVSAWDEANRLVRDAMSAAFNAPYRSSDGRLASEVYGPPLDRADWPKVGDEVLYRDGATGRWQPALVLEVAAHDGDLKLDTGQGPTLAALDAKHGNGLHCWLLYRESPK